MPLQRLDERREKGDEPFGADAVGGVPGQEQRVLDIWSILRRTRASKRLPLLTREIIYGLLKGEQGARLSHLAAPMGYTSSTARAVERLRHDFDQPLHIEELARELGMSASGLRQNFKAVTAISPSQFQKQLRLQEARRLMLDEDLDALSAAYRVGYRDASHFNREYKSLFGVPPMRDMQRLREAAFSSI